MRSASCPRFAPRGLLLGLLAVALLGLVTSVVPSQEANKPNAADEIKKESFEAITTDGVKLVGDFYPSKQGRNAPVVILLHAVGPGKTGASRKDFGTGASSLPVLLQKEGYAVLAFDFRGHGDSTGLDDPKTFFFVNPVRGLPPNRLPNRIEAKDTRLFRSAHDYAKLGNDLIAAKEWLNLKNNAGECNSTNVVLIGAEQGAVVGTFWAYGEFIDLKRRKPSGRPEGEDISAFIWLSMLPRLGVETVELPLQSAMRAMAEKVPTFAMYGEQDQQYRSFWDRAIRWIKDERNKERFEATGIKVIKTNLQGTAMLNKDALKTNDLIIAYLKEFLPQRQWQEQPKMRPPTLFAIDRLGIPIR